MKSLLLLSLLPLQTATTTTFVPYPATSGQPSLTFSAAGDYGTSPESLQVIASDGGDFHLALGDLSYEGNPGNWCDEVKSAFPNFVIVSGNHDESDMDGYILACPFPFGTVTGDYGLNYYFDYPAPDPLIRIIMGTPGVSPDIGSYDYSTGGNGYVFVRDAVRNARSNGIPWVAFGSHKVCIEATGDKSCEVGTDLMDMLFQEKVDLILMAHAHTYQRTHQLSCGSPDSFTQSCVVDSDNEFVKGAGTVQVIQGIGGRGTRDRGTAGSEPDFNYFARIMGSDGCWPEENCPSADTGIVQYTVTDTGITGKAMATDGTVFDTFTIGEGGTVRSSPLEVVQALWPVLGAIAVIGLVAWWTVRRTRRSGRPSQLQEHLEPELGRTHQNLEGEVEDRVGRWR